MNGMANAWAELLAEKGSTIAAYLHHRAAQRKLSL